MAENIFFLYFFLYFFTAQHMAENISNMHNSRSILHIQPVCNTHNMFTTHNTYHTLYRRKHMEYIQSPFAFCTPLALASVKLPLNLQTRNFKDWNLEKDFFYRHTPGPCQHFDNGKTE